jgi:hypothetical protein
MASDSFIGFLSALLFLSLSRENNTVASSWSHSLINFALDLFGIPGEISWQSRHMMMVVLMMVVVIMMVVVMMVVKIMVMVVVMMMMVVMVMMVVVVMMMLVLLVMVEVLVRDYDVNLVCIYIKVDLRNKWMLQRVKGIIQIWIHLLYCVIVFNS